MLSAFCEKTQQVEEFFVDNNQSGKDSAAIADHCNHSLSPYLAAGLKVTGGTFDTGGGGNGRVVVPKLVENRTLSNEGLYNPCFFHGWNKPLEASMIESMGVGGLGRRTLLQLTIACWHLMKCYPLEQFKRTWKETMEHFISSEMEGLWEDEHDKFVTAMGELTGAIEEGKVDGLTTFQAINRAVLTRWRYVNKGVRHLFENWIGCGGERQQNGRQEGYCRLQLHREAPRPPSS